MYRTCVSLLLGFSILFVSSADEPKELPPLKNSNPLSPKDEQATFAIPPGFRVELVASEPNVVDPVSMTIDERGRIFVAEMRGYPNGGRGIGKITSGRIRMLEDRDGDGFYESSVIWKENLRFPTGMTPWRGGLLVANAPDLIYLKDSKGTGKADTMKVLYTGFDLANIQQLLNTLQFTLDNRIYATAGGAGGTIKSVEKPDAPVVSLRGRGIRFNPDVPASLEPTSSGGQYGLTADDYGRWFTATNSQHLRHIILPDEYLRRNPSLAVRAVTLDIPEHGAACKVYRKSPFEAWRVERTTRRAGSVDAKRFPKTELVPGGYSTSSCSPVIYIADQFPKEFIGSVFICDPANNVIMRDVLTPNGATYISKRGHPDSEFLASTDNWFRPVHLMIGPDSALYVLDFYREVIETPLSLPPDILKRVNVETRGRGRIWRITTAPKGTKPPRVALDKASDKDLVAYLSNPNPWWRLNAQRLLYERKAKGVIPALEKLAASTDSPVGRVHALWTLEGLGALNTTLVEDALTDKEAGVREQALRLADSRVSESWRMIGRVFAMTDDPSPRVRFQLAFTLGQFKNNVDATTALAKLARRADTDSWTQTAILSSVSKGAPALLQSLMKDDEFTKSGGKSQLTFLTRLATLVGTQATDAELGQVLTQLGASGKEPTALQVALLDGLGQGLALSSRPLGSLWNNPPKSLADAVAKATPFFTQAATVAIDAKRPLNNRVAAVTLLGRGPFDPLKKVAGDLLSPRMAPEIQLATVRALAGQSSPEVSAMLLASWPGASPTLRREMTEVLFARKDRLNALVTAMEKKQILPSQIEPLRLQQLRKHPDAKLRARATATMKGLQSPARTKVVAAYQEALKLKSDVSRGKAVFKKNCATCHRLENVGVQVGADLLAALRNKTESQLLIDVLDPSREVDPRYLAYQVTTRRGQVLTGLISAETASSLTLKRGEGAEDTVLRSQIEAIESTGKSLMPEGLEMQVSKQDLADLIAYLLQVSK